MNRRHQHIIESLTHQNQADDEEFAQSIEQIKKGVQDGSLLLFNLKDSSIKLDAEYDTIGQLLEELKNAAKHVDGDTLVVLSDPDTVNAFKIVGIALGIDDVVTIKLDISKDDELTAEQTAAAIESGMRKVHASFDLGYVFEFRGNILEVESITVLINSDIDPDDDGATLSIVFTDESIEAGRKDIGECLTGKQVLDEMQTFFDEKMPNGQRYCDKLKVVAVHVDDAKKQNVYQVSYPRKEGDHLVFNLSKCSSWRFNDIAKDPETLTVADFMKRVKSLSSNDGYVFLKAKDGTYGISGIDLLQTGGNLLATGPREMLALILEPWSRLFESKKKENDKMKKNNSYVQKKLQETIDYWEKQLKAGNYRKEPTRKQILESIMYWERELKNPHSKRVVNEEVQFKYFIQMFSCFEDGTPSDVDLSEIGYECEESYQKFDSKSQAFAVAKRCSKKAHEARVAEAYEDAECTPETAPEFMKHILEDCHVIAIVKYGDEYENSICGYFIDGKPTNIPLARIVQHYEE